jgi:hypothetical protein
MNDDDTQDKLDQAVFDALIGVLSDMRAGKPDDRSEKDRYYAIAITDLQKLMAYVKHWIVQG